MWLKALLPIAALTVTPIAAHAQSIGGFYVGGAVGVGNQANANQPIYPAADTSLLPPSNRLSIAWREGYTGALSMGYGFAAFMGRLEVEGVYRHYDQIGGDSLVFSRRSNLAGGSSQTTALMINGIIDLEPRRFGINLDSVAFYIGGGAGFAWRRLDGVGGAIQGNRIRISETVGAPIFQFMVGAYSDLAWAGLPQWIAGVEYRYVLDGTDNYTARVTGPTGARFDQRADIAAQSNNVLFTLRYALRPRALRPAPVAAVTPQAAATSFTITFDDQSAALSLRAKSISEDVARGYLARRGTRVELGSGDLGTATSAGTAALSAERLNRIISELVRLGVPRHSISSRAVRAGWSRLDITLL